MDSDLITYCSHPTPATSVSMVAFTYASQALDSWHFALTVPSTSYALPSDFYPAIPITSFMFYSNIPSQ